MSSVELPVRPRLTLGPRARVAAAVALCAVAATVFVLVRAHADYPVPSFGGACERLRRAGPTPTDRLQRTVAGRTYGRAAGDGTDPASVVVAAIKGCGSAPWSQALLRPPPWRSMCDGVDDPSYLICRIVQVLEKQTLKDPTPMYAAG